MSEWNYPPSPYPGDPGFIGPPVPFWIAQEWAFKLFLRMLLGY